MKEATKGFKGFNLEGACRGMHYSPGETYAIFNKKRLECCTNSGLHFCIKPEDVWRYYSPDGSKYAEVTAPGKCIGTPDPYDSKRATRTLTIGKYFYSAFEFARRFFKKARARKTDEGESYICSGPGYCSRYSVIGVSDRQCIEATKAISIGSSSAIYGEELAFASGFGDIVTSKRIAIGIDCRTVAKEAGGVAITTHIASGVLGSRLVFLVPSACSGPIAVHVFLVDGRKVKPNVWYYYANGKLREYAD